MHEKHDFSCSQSKRGKTYELPDPEHPLFPRGLGQAEPAVLRAGYDELPELEIPPLTPGVGRGEPAVHRGGVRARGGGGARVGHGARGGRSARGGGVARERGAQGGGDRGQPRGRGPRVMGARPGGGLHGQEDRQPVRVHLPNPNAEGDGGENAEPAGDGEENAEPRGGDIEDGVQDAALDPGNVEADAPWVEAGRIPDVPVFSEEAGPRGQALDAETVGDTFELFFTDELVGMIVTETNRLVTAQGKNKLGLLDYQKLLVASLCNQIDQNVNIVVDEVAAQMEVDNEEDGKGEEREEGQAGANHGVLEAAPAMGAPRGPRKDPTSRLVGNSELTPGPHFLLLQGKPALRGSAESAGIGAKLGRIQGIL